MRSFSLFTSKPFCVCVCFFVLAWHLSFHGGCLPDRERGAHTKSVYGGGRLKAIIIYPRMHRGNDGSVKAFCAVNGTDAQTHLSPSRFEAWCAGRPRLSKEAQGRGCSRILHPNRHKGLTLTLFQRSSACLGSRRRRRCGCLHVHLSLSYDSLPPAAFCSFTSDHICKLFPSFFFFFLQKQPHSPGWTRGFPEECVSGRLSHGFLCCQPEWNVMSCQENCEAISELSSVRSVTFGVAGSWCLPGALGPNWDLSAEPGELPRLFSIPFTHRLSRSLFRLLSLSLTSCLPLCSLRLFFSI